MITVIPDISIKAFHGDREIITGKNGSLGRLQSGKVTLNFEAHDRYTPFRVIGERKDLKWLEQRNSVGEHRHSFAHRVQIERDMRNTPCTKPNKGNDIRLLEFCNDFSIQFWTVSVISQNGHFFLVQEKGHHVICYLDGEEIVCPALEGWPQMVGFLRGELECIYDQLPLVENYKLPAEPDASHLTDGRAIVLWWSCQLGVGALRTLNGDAKIHWTQIPSRDGLRYLTEGDTVLYDKLEKPKNATSFKYEAKGLSFSTIS